jgi:hypothetical protein
VAVVAVAVALVLVALAERAARAVLVAVVAVVAVAAPPLAARAARAATALSSLRHTSKMQINRTQNLFSTSNDPINKPGWETVTVDEWNALIASGWVPTLYVPPYRVSKDTITSRVVEAGKLADLMALIASLTPEQQFLWGGFSWFWGDNATVAGMCQQLGLDPAVILAPDPYLT